MKNLKLCILWILLIIQTQNLLAQKKYLFSKDYWHKGSVELKSGKQINGLIKYFLDENILMVKQEDNTLATLQSFQVLNFRITDSLTKVERNFITLKAKEFVPKTKFAFYETIFIGYVSLFSREKLESIASNSRTQPKLVNQKQLVFREDFFMLNQKGKFEKFEKLDRLAYFLEQDTKDLEVYIDEQKLDLEKRKDLKSLFNHFNISIVQKDYLKPVKDSSSTSE